MPRTIDWLYFRKAWTTCQNAQGFLGPAGVTVAETVDATKIRIGRDDALKLVDGLSKLIAVKGRKVELFDLGPDRPDDDTLAGRLLGPTGNLRAPTARVGKTLVVGFNPDAYGAVFGG